MNVKKAVGTSALAAGIGIAGLLGSGVGTFGADPDPDCGRFLGQWIRL